MCVVAAKWFADLGWVGVKNRDRNYRPKVRIKKNFRNRTEKLYMWDEDTRYAEGLNQHGVCILSAAVMVKKDEEEGFETDSHSDFYSPDGRKIRRALEEKTVEQALQSCIDSQLPGNTIIFDRNTCYLLEGSFRDAKHTDYVHKSRRIPRTEVALRTNHGIWLPWAGYQHDGDSAGERASARSSHTRYKLALKGVERATDPHQLLDAMSVTPEKNPQLNPIRVEKNTRKKIMRTTGQIMLIASNLTLHYRPIFSDIEFDFNKLNHPQFKTNFEIASSKKLFTTESVGADPASETIDYFAYGSNMDQERLEARVGPVLGGDPASATGWQLVFDKPSVSGTSVANIQRQLGTTWGRIWQLTPHQLEILNRYETGYDMETITVDRNGQAVQAVTYVYSDEPSAAPPAASYVLHLIRGAGEAHLPTDYTRKIASLV